MMVYKKMRDCFGGMAGIPKRAFHLESKLLNQPWEEGVLRASSDSLKKILLHCPTCGALPNTAKLQLTIYYFAVIMKRLAQIQMFKGGTIEYE